MIADAHSVDGAPADSVGKDSVDAMTAGATHTSVISSIRVVAAVSFSTIDGSFACTGWRIRPAIWLSFLSARYET